MNSFVFYRSGIDGGTGSFAIRLSKKLNKENVKVYYMCHEVNNVYNFDSLRQQGVIFLKPDQLKAWISLNEDIVILAYSIEEFCEASRVFKKYKRKTMLLYPVMNGITGDRYKNHRLFSDLNRMMTKSYINRLYINDCIMFPTEKIKDKYTSFYHLADHNVSLFFNLPIEMEQFDISLVKKRFNSNPKKIITVLRTDFPLKGYVFGLIEDIKKLWTEGYNVSIVIIASGNNVKMITESLSDAINQGRASVIEGCSYEKLKEVISDSYLSVGHGTSVLDATSQGVPNLVSADLTFSNKHGGLLNINQSVTAHENTAEFSYYDSLKALCELTFHEYNKISLNEYNYTKSKYSMDTFYEKLKQVTGCLSQKEIQYYSSSYYFKHLLDMFLLKLFKI